MNIKQSFKLLAMFLSVLFVLFPLQKAFAEVIIYKVSNGLELQ